MYVGLNAFGANLALLYTWYFEIEQHEYGLQCECLETVISLLSCKVILLDTLTKGNLKTVLMKISSYYPV